MLIYSCDSTASTASVALCDGERLICEYTQNNGNTHSETLLPMTENMFRSVGITAADIELYAVSAGPGSFTGVRIGAAHIKGLAFGRTTPVVGVSTLEALAYNVKDYADIVCPVMDARRSQVYTAFFEIKNGEVVRLCEDKAISISELLEAVSSFKVQGRNVTLVGDGYNVVKKQDETNLFTDCPERLRYQSAYSVAQTALKAYERGEYTDAAGLKPVYLRLPQAERERNERLAKENQ